MALSCWQMHWDSGFRPLIPSDNALCSLFTYAPLNKPGHTGKLTSVSWVNYISTSRAKTKLSCPYLTDWLNSKRVRVCISLSYLHSSIFYIMSSTPKQTHTILEALLNLEKIIRIIFNCLVEFCNLNINVFFCVCHFYLILIILN